MHRQIIDALLPRGSAWNVKDDAELDKLFNASGVFYDDIQEALRCLACIRDPGNTTILSDLEKEYGIATDTRLTEATRRMQLAQRVYFGTTTGSKTALQNALQAAGFDVQVHENSPAIDPDVFLNSIPFMVAGGDNAYAGFIPSGGGDSTAIAGKTGGDLLVNGDAFTQRPDYLVAAGSGVYAGEPSALAGTFNELIQEEIIYQIPDDPNTWPFFFFVGGDATRNVDGELTSIATANVPISQKKQFENIILRIKPLHTWAGLIINYT